MCRSNSQGLGFFCCLIPPVSPPPSLWGKILIGALKDIIIYEQQRKCTFAEKTLINRFYHALMPPKDLLPPKDADGIGNSEDPAQTAPVGAF